MQTKNKNPPLDFTVNLGGFLKNLGGGFSVLFKNPGGDFQPNKNLGGDFWKYKNPGGDFCEIQKIQGGIFKNPPLDFYSDFTKIPPWIFDFQKSRGGFL